MVIFCRICKARIQSFKPAGEAQKDVLARMSVHLGSHKPEAEQIAQAVMIASVQLMVRQYVDIPDDETELLESVRKAERFLIELLDFQPEEQEAN